MTDERIRIIIDTDGTSSAKSDFTNIGKVGMNAADSIRKAFRDTYADMSGAQTNLAREARIAMNSWALMERDKATAARATAKAQMEAAREAAAAERSFAQDSKESARELSQSKHAMYKLAQMDARAAASAEASAARQAAKDEIAAARSAAAAERATVASSMANFNDLQRRKAASAKMEAAQEVAINKEKNAKEAAANRASNSLNRDGSRGMGLITGAIGYLGVRELGSEFVKLSDTMQNVRNRLAIVTTGSADTEVVMGKLKNIAIETRTEFDLVGRTYSRLAQSTRNLKVSQQSNLDMTKVLTQAIAVSGATTEEARATLIQFSQAMGSNRLSADEFRSVAEQLPIILDMIAKSTGKPKVELKKMGEAGLLTARVMSIALLESVDDMDAKFTKTMPTIEKAWQNLKTEIEFTVDAFNKATGASKAIIDSLEYIHTHMDMVATIAIHVGELLGVYLVVQIGLLGQSLYALALANPFVAMVIGATQLLQLVSENRESVRSWIHDTGVLLAGGIAADSTARQTVKLGPNGEVLSNKLADGTDLKAAGDKDNQLIHEQYAMEQRKAEIARLRAMKDTNTKKKHHQETFEEAIGPLEGQVGDLTINKAQRDTLKEVMEIEEKLSWQDEQGHKHKAKLTKDQYDYVDALVHAKKAMLDFEATNKDLFKRDQDRQQFNTKFRHDAQLLDEKYDKEYKAHIQTVKSNAPIQDSFSADDVKRVRDDIRRGYGNGDLTKDQANRGMTGLELVAKDTKTPRKEFLEEFTDKGKMNEQVKAIWGPDGTLNHGLSSAIAQTLVFHKSFKTALKDLGKSIQAEIIDTLVQGLIRMAILTAMGGAKAGAGATLSSIVLPARGTPHSSGGYVGDMGRTQIAGYVHGGEYVVNANATQGNRDMLDTINKGGRVRGGSQVNVTIHNNGTNSDFETRSVSANEVEIIATRIVNTRAPSVVAGTMRDPNSRMSKSITNTTTARRAR